MDGEKWMIVGGILVAVFVIEWLRSQAFQNGRLAGIREATLQVSRNCSYHYEQKDEPLPKNVDEALVYMADALKRGRGVKGKIELYLIGSGMLGDAMGESAYQKGFDAGRRWSDPSDGERRIDMSLEGWRAIRYLTDIGFLHQMPNYKRMLHFPFDSKEKALHAEAAIEKLEFAINHREHDPEYSDSLQRNMLVWNQWPNDAQSGTTGREG
jgi:hypothetical protein